MFEKTPTYTFTIEACTCKLLDKPHYHVGPSEVIPWDTLKSAMDKFNKNYSVEGKCTVVHGMPVEIDPSMGPDKAKIVTRDKEGNIVDSVEIQNIGSQDPYEAEHGEKRPAKTPLCDHKSEMRGGTINTEGEVHYCTICELKFANVKDL